MVLALLFAWVLAVDIDDSSVSVASCGHIPNFQLEAVILVNLWLARLPRGPECIHASIPTRPPAAPAFPPGSTELYQRTMELLGLADRSGGIAHFLLSRWLHVGANSKEVTVSSSRCYQGWFPPCRLYKVLAVWALVSPRRWPSESMEEQVLHHLAWVVARERHDHSHLRLRPFRWKRQAAVWLGSYPE